MTLRLVPPAQKAPERVAIVGLGPSLVQYVSECRALGGRKAVADETWVINALGDTLAHDRVFHMDDVRIQQVRAEGGNQAVGVMLDWLKRHPGPVYTSRAHVDYPGLVEFPLEDVVNDLHGEPYFNSTAAYAIAFAIHIGVKAITLYGLDYTYPNAHSAEKGRACVEFWLGVAMSRGVNLSVAESSSLLDMVEDRPLYGYGQMGSLDVKSALDERGRVRFSFTEREALPTAAEIEAAYDHSKHPNPRVAGQAQRS